MSHDKDQRRILKNTVMLYIRMAVIMVVSLYTSRVVLQVLGVSDYGVYNIVGGVVISLVFITNTLTSSTQRFLSYEIGLADKGLVSEVFSMSINIHVLFIIGVIFLLETAGIWFLNNVLVIPDDRQFAANVVYQTSILIFCTNLIRVPYNALIISTEKMNVYAIVSIVEALLKLLIVYLITLFSDKLIAYGVILLLSNVLVNLCYMCACRILCSEYCKYRFNADKGLLHRMLGFSGWNMFGGITGVAVNEGPNYLMNIFLGVQLNAAMGLAKQVSGAIYSFTSNFQTAFNPQIVKSYAAKDTDYLYDIVFKSSKISFFLMVIFAVPTIAFSDTIFNIWLVEVPEYAISFCIIMMISQMVSAIGSPLWMVVHATGNIKKYQITLSCINLLVLPLSWVCLKIGITPISVIVTQLFLNIIILFYRINYLRLAISFPAKRYIVEVLIHCFITALFSFSFAYCVSFIPLEGYDRLFLFGFSFMITLSVIYYIGLSKNMRKEIRKALMSKLLKKQ